MGAAVGRGSASVVFARRVCFNTQIMKDGPPQLFMSYLPLGTLPVLHDGVPI